MSGQTDLVVDRLIGRLNDADPVTRLNAAGALRLHGPRAAAAIPVLSRLLSDSDPKVRAEASRALQRIRTDAA